MDKFHGCGPTLNTTTQDDSSQFVATSVLAACVVGFAFVYVVGAYLQRSSIENLLSFFGADRVPPYPGVTLPRPWGVHYFGDFMLPVWQSNLKNPWIYQKFDGPIVNNYLPFTMAVFWVFGRFDYWRGFILYEVFSLTLFVAPMWCALRRFGRTARLELIASTVFFTAPFISLLDRGNAQLMLIGACGLAVFLLISGHSTTGAVVLGLAVALKGYPILFVLLWLRRHRWRDSVLAVATAGVCTVVPLLLYRGGFFANIRRILQNVRTNEEAYTRVYISYNQSLRGSLRSIASLDLGPVSRFSSTVLTHFGLVAAVSLVLGIFLVLQKTTTLFEQTMVICSLVIVSVDYVAPYAIGVFFVACITLWTEASELPKMWVVVHALLLALLLAPKGFPVTFWSDNFDYGRPTYGSLLGGLTALAVMVCVLSRYLALRMRTNSAVVKVSP